MKTCGYLEESGRVCGKHWDGELYQCVECEEREQAQGAWVDVQVTLPELERPVFLVDMNRLENTGTEGPRRHVQMAGYLNEFGGHYWSVYGQRGMNLSAFTHWCYAPEEPKERVE
jgi:hypothetical protein